MSSVLLMVITTLDLAGVFDLETREQSKRAIGTDKGFDVIVTDHHLPPSILPTADAIVNPNQLGCNFPSKNQ